MRVCADAFGLCENAALRLTATAIPRFNVRQLLFGRVNYEKTNTIIIAAAFLLVGCMFAHVGCIPYDPSMMESYWGAQSGGNSIFDNDANNWNGSAGESLFQTPNTYDGQDQQYQQPDSQQNQPAITEEPTEDPNIPMTTKEPDSLEIYELKVEPLWGGWYADELIGEGGYGRVYRMVHNSSAGAFYSACKYISIPKNEYEMTVTAQYTINRYRYLVIFVDGLIDECIDVQWVEHGADAEAPEAPKHEDEGFTFTGWDVEFTNVTSKLIVTAQYENNNVAKPTQTPCVYACIDMNEHTRLQTIR